MAVRKVDSVAAARKLTDESEVLLKRDGKLHRLLRYENDIDEKRHKGFLEASEEKITKAGGLVEEGFEIKGEVILGRESVVLGTGMLASLATEDTYQLSFLSSKTTVLDSVIVGSLIAPETNLFIRNAGLIYCAIGAGGRIIGTAKSLTIAYDNVKVPPKDTVIDLLKAVRLPDGASDFKKARMLNKFVSGLIRHDMSGDRRFERGELDSCDDAVSRGTGICVHQGLLLKWMAAEAGLESEVVCGTYLPKDLGHLWVEFRINGNLYIADHFGFRPYLAAGHNYQVDARYGTVL